MRKLKTSQLVDWFWYRSAKVKVIRIIDNDAQTLNTPILYYCLDIFNFQYY